MLVVSIFSCPSFFILGYVLNISQWLFLIPWNYKREACFTPGIDFWRLTVHFDCRPGGGWHLSFRSCTRGQVKEEFYPISVTQILEQHNKLPSFMTPILFHSSGVISFIGCHHISLDLLLYWGILQWRLIRLLFYLAVAEEIRRFQFAEIISTG